MAQPSPVSSPRANSSAPGRVWVCDNPLGGSSGSSQEPSTNLAGLILEPSSAPSHAGASTGVGAGRPAGGRGLQKAGGVSPGCEEQRPWCLGPSGCTSLSGEQFNTCGVSGRCSLREEMSLSCSSLARLCLSSSLGTLSIPSWCKMQTGKRNRWRSGKSLARTAQV